jgi:hypothetical protein
VCHAKTLETPTGLVIAQYLANVTQEMGAEVLESVSRKASETDGGQLGDLELSKGPAGYRDDRVELVTRQVGRARSHTPLATSNCVMNQVGECRLTSWQVRLGGIESGA